MILEKLKRLKELIQSRGIRYTYNTLYFYWFWGWISSYPRLLKIYQQLAVYPRFIEVEVTTRCNLRCIICERTYWHEPNKDMTYEQFKYILDQFPDLKWIGLTGIGESFVNKDFMKILRLVKSKPIFVELYDNFFLVDEKISSELLDLGIDRISISLDAATKETYEKIRPGSNFERVIDNVKTIFETREKKNKRYLKIDFHYIVTKYNIHELPLYIDLVSSISKNSSIQISRMLHPFEEIKDTFVEIPEELIEETNKKAKEKNIPIQWGADVPAVKSPINRCINWTMPFIFVTGDVVPCCSGNEANNRDFQKKTALGNIFEQNFKDIWYGEKYNTLRRKIINKEVPIQCVNCCGFETGCKTK